MNIAINSLIKVYAISQIFLPWDQMYNLLYKSYCCVMENTTVNAVNAAKNTLWQSNVSNLLKSAVSKNGYSQFNHRQCPKPLL